MPTEFLSGIVLRLPFNNANIALINGAGQFSSGGTLNLFIQGRNRAGYTLTSTAISPIVYTATQAIEISFPITARTPSTDYHYYIISHSPTGNPNDAIALFHWRNYELDQITERPLSPVRLSRDEHIELASSVAVPADLPTVPDLLPGMRRLVVGGIKSSAYYEYQELETRSPDLENIVLQPRGIEKWVRTGSPNVGVINSIYDTDGCSTPINEVEPTSLIAAPPYAADGTKGTPIKLIYRNDSASAMPRGTAFLLQVQLEGAPASQLFDGKLILTPRGFVNLDNGSIDISDGLGGEMPDIGGDVPFTFGSRSTLFLHKDLPAGQAYFIEIAPYFSVAQLEGRILEGANISINITPAAQSGENAYGIWQVTGNIVFKGGDRLRVIPGVGLNARIGSGTALIERFTFPERGARDVYGIAPNLSEQKITLDGNGSLFYRGTGVVPITEQERAIVDTSSGYSKASTGNSIVVNANSSLALTLSYPCDADGDGLVRLSYPTIAGNQSAKFNPPYVRLFVKKQSNGRTYQLPNLIAVAPGVAQQVTISNLDGATEVAVLPSPPSTDFCLFDPPLISATATSGTLEADTYTAIAAYYFDGSAISRISHSAELGCLIEADTDLGQILNRVAAWAEPATTFNDLRNVKADARSPFQSRYCLKPSNAQSAQVFNYNPESLAIDDNRTVIKPTDVLLTEPGRWMIANVGISPSLSVGFVGTTTDPTAARVTISGTPANPLLNFILPTAEVALNGGASSASGASLPIPGKKGKDGKSGETMPSASTKNVAKAIIAHLKFEIGSVVAGSEAAARLEQSGDKILFHFVLPEGKQGKRGIPGES